MKVQKGTKPELDISNFRFDPNEAFERLSKVKKGTTVPFIGVSDGSVIL